MNTNKTVAQQNSQNIPRNRFVAFGLLVWMLGVMLFGWFVLDGPGVSSLVKRVAPLKRAQQTLRRILGEPAGPASYTETKKKCAAGILSRRVKRQ